MGITVNTNISSINAQRSLYKTQNTMSKAMERLASGLRINHAADDAAGLAIADGLQSQVRGLSQAVRNANDGISVIGSAEGAVTQQTEILQRIRELAIQAANGINSASNRQAIQREIDAQVEELTRIGNTTEFNGSTLLDGTFSNKKLQVGAQSGQTLTMSIGDFRAANMGHIAQHIGVTNASATGNQNAMRLSAGAIDGSTNAGAGLTGVVIQVGTETYAVPVSTSDGISNLFADRSAIAKATAINDVQGQTGVRATVGAAVYVGSAIVGGTTAATTRLEINGVEILNGGTNPIAVGANDATGTLRAAINGKSNETGVTADLDSSNRLRLTAADGRNIIVQTFGAVANAFNTTGLGLVATLADGTSGANQYLYQATGAITLTSNGDFSITSDATAATNLLGLTTTVTQHTIDVAVDVNKAVNTIDVTDFTGASLAIDIIDSALNGIAEAQSELGALSNRLQNTIANLQVSIENLSASESRIRDADFAVETANLTRAQILEQAGTAVLAQANVRPQSALALLG